MLVISRLVMMSEFPKPKTHARYPFTGFPLCKCIPTTTFSWEDWNWWAFSTN